MKTPEGTKSLLLLTWWVLWAVHDSLLSEWKKKNNILLAYTHACGSFSGLTALYWEQLKLRSGCDKNTLKHMEYSSMAHSKRRLLSYRQCKRVHPNVRCHTRWPTPFPRRV